MLLISFFVATSPLYSKWNAKSTNREILRGTLQKAIARIGPRSCVVDASRVLSSQPTGYRLSDKIGRILLNEVICFRDSHQRQIFCNPFPIVI